MPIDEKKLRTILAEHGKDSKRQVGQLQEDFKRHVGLLAEETDRKVVLAQEEVKRHVGLLVEETDRKIDLVQEGFQGLAEKLEMVLEEIAGIRNEIEEIRLHLFRKADLERLEALEKQVAALEKRLPSS